MYIQRTENGDCMYSRTSLPSTHPHFNLAHKCHLWHEGPTLVTVCERKSSVLDTAPPFADSRSLHHTNATNSTTVQLPYNYSVVRLVFAALHAAMIQVTLLCVSSLLDLVVQMLLTKQTPMTWRLMAMMF